MDFSGYNHQHYQQQQQQQQQQQVYDYDPSQIQSYDQSYSYQPYYAYDHQYGYFPNTHQPQFQFQPEPIPVHPPGVTPIAPEPAPSRATHAPTGPSQYRGRGGRAGRPFRGNGRGRGQFNHESPASYYGRGRGVGGGKHFPSHSSGPAISNVTGAPAAAGATSVVQPSSSVSGQTPLPKPTQMPAAARKACCEICKVECNTPEILEQHKNGKKHMKKMKVHEELQRRKAINEQQSGQVPTSQLNLADQTKKVQESEKKGYPTENLGSEVTADNHKDEIELQNNMGETSEVPAEEPEGKTTDKSAVRGRGLKRKMRGGKGGKYMRTNNGSRQVELPKPEQAISFRCELCSVKCESQVVYQSHLTGKKHLSKLKRVHGHQPSSGVAHQALAGVVGLQALYPPDINALSNAINAQIQQGDNDPQVLLAQLLMTVLSQAQVPAVAPLTGHVAAQIPAPTYVAGSTYEPQLLQTQVSETTSHVEMDNPTGEAKNEQLSVPLELNAMADKSGATNDQNLPSECEAPTS